MAVTVNNGNVILNASSGSNNVVVTSTANIATGTAQSSTSAPRQRQPCTGWATGFPVGRTLSRTRLRLRWCGYGLHLRQLHHQTVVTNQNALGVRTGTVTSNANNFSNFEKIDLTGYIGKSVGTLIMTPLIGSPTTTSVTTPTHTFDFGLTNGTSTVEGTTGGTVTQNAAATNLGSWFRDLRSG